MKDQTEVKGRPQDFTYEVFDKNPQAWASIKDAVLAMNLEGLDWKPDQPLLGQTDEIVAYPNVEEAFRSPLSTEILLRDVQGKLVGYTLAFPFKMMDPEGAKEFPNAAYIYFTVLDKDHRGQGLVGELTEPLFEELNWQKFSYAVRDSMRGNGYATKVARHYEGSIVRQADHNFWPEIGPETRFVIDIAKHLEDHPAQVSSEA